ncbi:hypothetical protein [Ruminococcus sp.]|uniref:hypothetical protein n=1 Tax=Ruminococcus sp. TaxID=41978 RepID=UPI0026011677|nr:hypothetical protein [Ruminococcus sp.]MCI6616022.1 hypothetical protein [Ruminococcus sp.]
MTQTRLFDLNIEQVLEHWEPEHAVREIIANALDEQILTNSKEIKIYKTGNDWHIRDYGRGIQYSHFTQNENKEKIESPSLIGKFGVGLKDALAVFYRKGIQIKIDSKYAHITLKKANKAGFEIETLHALFDVAKDTNMVGTDFVISGISDDAINKAKAMFLCFNQNAKLLENTSYGQVYSCGDSIPIIYINGVQVAIEDNFLFSYNITNINSKIKKALNRERTNVGRTAYSETVKNILRQCKSESVLLTLMDDLKNTMSGTNCVESGWVDIATYAAVTLNKSNNVVFMTPYKRANLTNKEVEILNQSEKTLIMVTDNVYSKIEETVNTFETIYKEYSDTFNYKFVSYESLTPAENKVFNLKENIISFLKRHNYKYGAQIKISETIKVDKYGMMTNGICIYEQNTIVVKRSVLKDESEYLGVLLHEFAHYQHRYPDNSRDFENELTKMLGYALFDNIEGMTNRSIKSIFNFWKK